MDVKIYTEEGTEFTVEVWYFAKLSEIKEAIQKRMEIPASSQRLFFNGRELDDDGRDTEHYSIIQGSRIRLETDEAS